MKLRFQREYRRTFLYFMLLYYFAIQGGWENDETAEQAALREAMEEAGVHGDLVVRTNNVCLSNFSNLLDVTFCATF